MTQAQRDTIMDVEVGPRLASWTRFRRQVVVAAHDGRVLRRRKIPGRRAYAHEMLRPRKLVVKGRSDERCYARS
jgi:hypothetical protein